MQNTVSREHFEIIIADDEDAMRLRSFSKAGTFVNRKRVVEYVRVEPGDRISIGAPPHESESACTLVFRLMTPAYEGSLDSAPAGSMGVSVSGSADAGCATEYQLLH